MAHTHVCMASTLAFPASTLALALQAGRVKCVGSALFLKSQMLGPMVQRKPPLVWCTWRFGGCTMASLIMGSSIFIRKILEFDASPTPILMLWVVDSGLIRGGYGCFHDDQMLMVLSFTALLHQLQGRTPTYQHRVLVMVWFGLDGSEW